MTCATSHAMKLYTHPLSPHARRAELCLYEYEIPFERVIVNLAAGEQRGAPFLAMNPNGKVPVLEDGDVWLPESTAILLYLASLYPERGLDGRTRREKAEVLRWVCFNAGHMGPAGTQVFRHTRLLPDASRVSEVARDGRAELLRCFALVETDLAGRAWMAGDSFSLADISMAPNVWFARSVLEVDFAPYPHVIRWLRAVQERPSWERVYST